VIKFARYIQTSEKGHSAAIKDVNFVQANHSVSFLQRRFTLTLCSLWVVSKRQTKAGLLAFGCYYKFD
jgi:hypothetical protein